MIKLGSYTIEKLLGEGSFGKVHLTKKEGDSKKYATKELDREEIDSSEAKKYLINEIRILQSLNHPNIVKFVDIKKTKKHYYIMMEFCNGGELSKNLEKYMIKNGTAFPEELVQHFMRQIIDAFKYIHGKKIIHRDVKLDNILLNFDNEEDKKNFNLMKAQVKIIDFGFSCIYNDIKKSILGSPINMDPLILKKLTDSTGATRELGYDMSADIWSIGTICYEMLIGKSAFDSNDIKELSDKIEKGAYKVPTNISAELVSFLNGMLQYEGKNRLNAEQLSRHAFLTKDVKQFKRINLNEISNKIEDNQIEVDTHENKTFLQKKPIKNSTIWSIYKGNQENVLTNISGNEFIDPVDEKEEQFFKESKKNTLLQLPSKGIPDNPKNQKINEMTEDDIKNLQKGENVKEMGFSYSGNIFGD
jgi:serine/threonine protein kinase